MIELLAPAANLQCGKAAINAGADAVYIGGPAFGAREKAGNSLEDISALADYAHLFGAKVYMVINTIIYDDELDEVERLIWQAWEAGVDALIIQDMGILEMNLPPISLHASTQTFNLTSERVKFHENIGFERVILERGISLAEIKEIRKQTSVELEAFVHGAICVGYSGQCYLSQALCRRSGNRGACAQPCRSNWTLLQEDGKILSRNQTLLSLGDLNLSERVEDLIDAGVCSLKIEGRLKDESYVVNNVAHYNRKLKESGVRRASLGTSTPSFEPNPAKSFSRSFSEFVLMERRPSGSQLNYSQGEFLGTIARVERDHFVLDCDVKISNGDGISFKSQKSGEIVGTNINSVFGQKVFPNRMDQIEVGAQIYRNMDRAFNPKAGRKIDVKIIFRDGCVEAVDESGVTASVDFTFSEPATNAEKARENITNAMSKSGDTIFRITDVEVAATPFMTASGLNEIRRSLLAKLTQARAVSYKRKERNHAFSHPQFYSKSIDYTANVANRLAEQFYRKCGVETIQRAYEIEQPTQVVLLRTRHCVRREMGMCLKERGVYAGALFIENNGRKLQLQFDCRECEMMIVD